MKTLRNIILAFVVLLPGYSCAQGTPDRDTQNMASALTKVASAVESTVHVKKHAGTLKDMDLLKKATEHDPSLLAPFGEYELKAEQNGNHAIVVVCQGGKILLMDATCTRKADQPPPELEPGSRCIIAPQLIDRLCPSRQ
ncbi:MAG: hypothetical protein CVU73_08950 [Deltaproteobacteria bacterium HGW-Deltaproteobacteria-8]|jgi:hypothetical protein|nr:MAG: hypothetical protein CVU73_08950 [Deltaproteobacteria bacterium HGW-Deltaproteobacteria-8]